MILQTIRNSRIAKCIMVFMSLHICMNVFWTYNLFALTSGPSQPEMQGPSAIGNTDFVDSFTGDFNYSIPLFDELGIPLTMNYNSGVTMDQESSWVGLGWSLNPGAITRNVRGLPDDFKGDQVVDKLNIKENKTIGASVGASLEVFGISDPGIGGNLSINVFHNNYTGFGLETSLSASISAGDKATIGLDLTSESATSFGDIGISPKFDIGAITKKLRKNNGYDIPLAVGMDFSSSDGLKALSINSTTNNWYGKLGMSTGQISGNQTYTPTVDHSFLNEAFTFNGKIGLTAIGADANITLSGYGSSQKLRESDKELESRAYGYLYYTNQDDGNILLDFNREKDGTIDENSPNLPLAELTYDIFSISSPGMSGSFRAYRNDVGYIEERSATVTSISGSGGLEFAGGLFVSPGVDVSVTNTNSTSTTWTKENENDNYLPFISNRPVNSLDENVYFEMMGESTMEPDPTFIDQFGGVDATAFGIEDFVMTSSLNNELIKKDGSSIDLVDQIKRTDRQPRVQNISYLTIEELEHYYDYANWHHIYEGAQPHHIGAIIVTSEDGTRYLYGLPAYNTSQDEINFSVGVTGEAESPDVDEENNLVTYNYEQISTNNHSGIDNYYSDVHTPAFAHSFLLTEILSADYVDVTGNGPSDDDLGTYIKYTYGDDEDLDGVYEPNSTFAWRTPTVDYINKANYWEGLTHNKTDDKASIVCGYKELWYLNKIETKNYVLKFYLENRSDGLGQYLTGLTDEDASRRQQRLSKISLFSKSDLAKEMYDDETEFVSSIPIKTVNFEYDYSLCPDVPNKVTDPDLDGTGKLTLTKVFFTYYDSRKGEYNPYIFSYNEGYDNSYPDEIGVNTHLYEYDPTNYDRWGNFKKESATLRNKDFPYTNQSINLIQDDYASAWCLDKIVLPSGGTITVDYERDDYSYVQNSQATQMYFVTGASENFDETGVGDNKLYDGTTNNLYLYFQLFNPLLDEDFDDASADAYIKSNFIVGENANPNDPDGVAQNLYFRFKLNTDDYIDIDEDEDYEDEEIKNEYISGYATVDVSNCGAIKNPLTGDYEKGYIKLNPGHTSMAAELGFSDLFNPELDELFIDDVAVNPISKAGWQFVMSNTRYNVTDWPAPGEELSTEDIIPMLADVSLFTSLFDMFFNPNWRMRHKEIARTFVEDESWIRLYNPNGHKYGGGCRVKEVQVDDNWNNMTADESNMILGKSYSYVLEDGRSSGVAAYEPAIGGDENPLRIPASYNHKDGSYKYEKYLEKPFGESFYPSPVVGYSRVTIQDLNTATPRRTGTGKIVNEFYTAKDFPVIVEYTELSPVIHEPGSILQSFFNISMSSIYTGSQGYSIHVNDMHGKPKKTTVFAQNSDTPLSSVEYKYNLTEDGALNNTVDCMNELSQVEEKIIGVKYDIAVDFRKSSNKTTGVSAKFNTDGFPVTIFPAFVLTVWPSVNFSSSSTRTAVMTKVITQNGILSEVIKSEDGSFIYEKNLVYDETTGSPLLVTTQNEYEEPYFTFTYPAHWVYEGMGSASYNAMFSFVVTDEDIDKETSEIIDEDLISKLIPGDQLYIHAHYIDFLPGISNDADDKYFIAWVYRDDTGAYFLIDANGEKLDLEDAINDPDIPDGAGATDEGSDLSKISGTVLRSGKRNLQTTPIGSIVTKTNPIGTHGDGDLVELGEMLMPELGTDEFGTSIIAANYNEFSNTWQNFCTENSEPLEDCFYTDDYTEASSDFFLFMRTIIDEGLMVPNDYEDGDADAFAPMIVDLNDPYDLSDNVYYHNMTAEVISVFDGFAEGASVYNFLKFWQYISESDNYIQIVSMYNSYNQDNVCNVHVGGEGVGFPSFIIEYGIDEGEDFLYDVESTFDLTSEEATWVFSHPEELTYEFIVPTEPTPPATEIQNFKIVYHYNYDSEDRILVADCGPFTCLPLRSCVMKSLPYDYCMGAPGQNVNPYLYGLLGVWKPKVGYMYKTERDYSSEDGLRDYGVFKEFSPFWKVVEDDGNFYWSKDDEGWQWTAQANLKDPFIDEVENINPLFISSSATFGNNHTLPEMISNNATYKQIGFENFEDDNYIDLYLDNSCITQHFDFDGTIDPVVSHTGNFSLKLEPEENTSYTYPLTDHAEIRSVYEEPPFILEEVDCLPPFSPDLEDGVKYILTFWVKQLEVDDPLFDFDDIGLAVDVTDGVITTSCLLDDPIKSQIIEGWQRFEYIVTIPALGSFDVPEISIEFENEGETNIYLDDIRIQPIDALAKCYVYDFSTQRLMAELDENHFATFYEYDEDGKLVRVKKETERGIMTIQEGKYFTVKNDN